MTVRDGWPNGINNKAQERNLPPGTVRDSVNVDPLNSGGYAVRASPDKRYEATNMRGCLAVGNVLLIADGESLVHYDTQTDSAQVIRSIAGSGLFVGDVLNEELFFCTENENLRFHAGSLRRWGVQDVLNQPVPSIVTGSLRPGVYQLAMTWFDGRDEGGTAGAIQIEVAANQAITVTLPSRAGHTPRLYVSQPGGSTLYLQCEGAGGYVVNRVDDSTARLETMHMRAPRPGSIVTQHNGVLAIADRSYLWVTTPLRPHLQRPMSGFFQFAAPIGFVISADGGLYVSADKTYFISGVESDAPAIQTVFDYASVAGTAVKSPDDKAVWMTRYGVAITEAPGQAKLISQEHFVPELAKAGSSGIVERNGNQLVVTTMTGGRGANPLAASDHYEAEIVTP